MTPHGAQLTGGGGRCCGCERVGCRERSARRREVADKKIDRSSTSAGCQPRLVPGGSRVSRTTRAGPASRTKILQDRIRHFETGTIKYLLLNVPNKREHWSRRLTNDSFSSQPVFRTPGFFKLIRTLTIYSLVTAADIRHRNTHRIFQAIHRSFRFRKL